MKSRQSKAADKAWEHPEAWVFQKAEQKAQEELEAQGYDVIPKEGFPDIVAFKDGKFAFFEIKKSTDRPEPHQIKVMEKLTKLGSEARIWIYDPDKERFKDVTNRWL